MPFFKPESLMTSGRFLTLVAVLVPAAALAQAAAVTWSDTGSAPLAEPARDELGG